MLRQVFENHIFMTTEREQSGIVSSQQNGVKQNCSIHVHPLNVSYPGARTQYAEKEPHVYHEIGKKL